MESHPHIMIKRLYSIMIVVSPLYYSEVEEELYRKLRDKCTLAVGTEIIQSHVLTLVHEVAADVYQTDVTDRLAQLERQAQQVKLIRCRRFYRKWLAGYKYVLDSLILAAYIKTD